jgi:hypothetical protein
LKCLSSNLLNYFDYNVRFSAHSSRKEFSDKGFAVIGPKSK